MAMYVLAWFEQSPSGMLLQEHMLKRALLKVLCAHGIEPFRNVEHYSKSQFLEHKNRCDDDDNNELNSSDDEKRSQLLTTDGRRKFSACTRVQGIRQGQR